MRGTKAVLMLFSLLLASTLTLFAQSSVQKMDELVTAYVTTNKFNGTVLVAQKGKVIFEKGYGLKNAKDSVSNTVNTIFQLGSVTKQFTAVIILKLAEQKKLSVTDKLNKYFPGFPAGDSITIRELLSHTSGIYNYTEDARFMQTRAVRPATQETMLALFRDKALNFTPGTKYSYSNSGYLLLGYIIQKVTGKPYEQVVRELIFQPLTMSHSGFDFTNLKSPDKATGYTNFSEKMKVQAGIVDSSVSFAAGAMYSTVGDLQKWHNGLQQYKIINKASTDAAYTPVLSNYGYGWSVDTLYGQKIVEHGGGIFGFNTHIARLPGDDVVVIILNNMNVGGLEGVARGLLAVLYNKAYEIPKSKNVISVPAEILQQYVGEYQLTPNFTMKITLVNNALKVLPTGQRAFDLYAESENVFFMKEVEASATFIKAADGTIERMDWKQGGRVQQGKKIN